MPFEVYRLTNRVSGKSYIGCTTKGIQNRWALHVRDAKFSKSRYLILQAIRKYGAETFVVEVVGVAESLESMFDLERHWIRESNTISPRGYNMTSGGDGAFDPSPEVIEMLRANAKGNTNWLGRRHSEETKAKMSASAKRTEAHRAAISRAQTGRVPSTETRAKISASKTGVKHGRRSPEVIKKFSELRREWWRNASPEKKRRMSEAISKAARGRPLSQNLLAASKAATIKPIRCIDLGLTFESVAAAVRWLRDSAGQSKAHSSPISRAAKKERGYKTAYGHEWRFVSRDAHQDSA